MSTNGGSLFAGELSELRIYIRTLSSAKIVALAQPPLQTFANVLVYPPEPTVDTTAYFFYCAAGFYGHSNVLQRNASDGTWAWASGATPSCTECGGSTHSYSGPSCSSCAAGAAFVSSALSCTPSSTLTAGPADMAFYLSGSAAEGVAAFSTIAAPSGISFSTSVFGVPNGSLVRASGSYLSAAGLSAPATLPSAGTVSWSLSAWVRCDPPEFAPWAAALEWGAAGDALGTASPLVAALVVAGPGSNVGPAVVSRACDSTWHHVAITYAPAPLTLVAFLDGAPELSASVNITLPPVPASTLRIGWSGDLSTNSGSLFAGELSEVRIYDRTLSVTEVVALSQPPLAAYLAAFLTPW